MEVGGGSSTGPGGGDCSSCSGTLSSTYTPGCSPLSSSCSFRPPGILSALDLDVEARAKKLGHIKRLVEEFRDAAAGGSALERWFSEMDIAWVLRLGVGDDDASAGAGAGSILASHSQQLQHLARCWILGLREIKDSTFVYMDGLCCNEEDAESTSEPPPPPPAALSEFSRFVQSTLLKMLPFVDAIAAHIPSCNCSSEQHGGTVSLQSPETSGGSRKYFRGD